jgi:hypothetical protein
VNILLQAVDRLGKDVEYYAVDLSLPELERTFGEIPTGKTISHDNVHEVEEETGTRGRVCFSIRGRPSEGIRGLAGHAYKHLNAIGTSAIYLSLHDIAPHGPFPRNYANGCCRWLQAH